MVIIMMPRLTNALHLWLTDIIRQSGVTRDTNIVAVPIIKEDIQLTRLKHG